MSPLSRLARLLNVHEKNAWDFYVETKKFLGRDSLEIKLLVDCITENKLTKPTARELSNFLRGKDNPASPPRSKGDDTPPPAPSPSPKSPKPEKPHDGIGAMETYKKDRLHHRSGAPSKFTRARGAAKPERDTRNFNRRVPRCPHGILITKKCAICDPDGFAKLGGND